MGLSTRGCRVWDSNWVLASWRCSRVARGLAGLELGRCSPSLGPSPAPVGISSKVPSTLSLAAVGCDPNRRISELCGLFRAGQWGMNVLSPVCVLNITDMNGLTIVDDGLCTVMALQKLADRLGQTLFHVHQMLRGIANKLLKVPTLVGSGGAGPVPSGPKTGSEARFRISG